jgi:hypothetical protein
MTDRELMQMALDALESVRPYDVDNLYGLDDEITALRDRLSQPEPVHINDTSEERVQISDKHRHEDWCASLTQLLLSLPPKPAPCDCKPPKREWAGLTDDDVREAFNTAYDGEDYGLIGDFSWFAEIIEAKLKEKNT